MSKSALFVNWLRSAAPYIHAFRGRTFVIAFGGEVVQGSRFVPLIHDINLLESFGVHLVLVHGARAQIETRLKERRLRTKFHGGLRVTSAEALACVKEVNGAVRVELEALLSMGVADSPMAGSDIRVASGNSVTAQPIGVVDGVDLQHTGIVRKIDAEQIRRRLENEEIVLLSPLGYSPTGEIFNLAMEDVAASAAIALKADKLIFLVDGPGVLNSRGKLLSETTAQEAERLLKQAPKQPEDVLRYLPYAIRASKENVGRCHLIDQNVDGGLLLEFFTREGVGTMMTRDPVENLRGAGIKDVGGILRLIEPLEAEGVLVKRNRELLEMEIGNFSVLDYDGKIIGCVALYPFAKERAAELACLAVNPEYRDSGRGERLLKHVEETARSKGVQKLFVLSARTTHWFAERGFTETNIETLPQEKKRLYNYQRRSKVFMKPLARR
jgi:amino-acid N-acetyltransferase